jgi:DNA polymerase-4
VSRAAVLAPRFAAYVESSRIVMDLLRTHSPLVEPLSLDEAYVDLAGETDRAATAEQGAELVEAAARPSAARSSRRPA